MKHKVVDELIDCFLTMAFSGLFWVALYLLAIAAIAFVTWTPPHPTWFATRLAAVVGAGIGAIFYLKKFDEE